ncbi:MAG TPA: outer membrane protein assembly factor BamD [Arcobacter sp.]|nr:outer membrane protein assembly factor BamD [Arcobacter sp.]HIP55576.1 outer membrane protein assembly factor BamD [Arcobacter sp.]
MIYKNIILIITAIILFSACSSKQEEEYNKPALYWYNKMLKEISLNQLDKADDTYTSLESEHRKSPLLPSALMIIAISHMEEEEYELAVYYFDDYIKRFEKNSLQDYVRYLKIKAKFFAFKQQFREQKLIDDTLRDIDAFTRNYSDSSYIYLVQTIQSRLYMAKASLDTEIAGLYERKDKPKAVIVYKEKAKKSWQELNTIKEVSVPWYRYIFE